MAILLSRFEQTTNRAQRLVFQPAVADALPDWTLIDLRADCTKVDGFTLVGSSGDASQAALLRSGGIKLGDSLDDAVGPLVRNRLGNNLGITLTDTTVRQLLRTLLIAEGKEDGTRWRALRADRDGNIDINLPFAGVADRLTVPKGGAVSDPFTYSNGALATVSSSAWVVDAGALKVASNHVECNASGGSGRARYATDFGTANNDSQFQVQFRGGTNHTGVFVAICRLAGSTYTGYGQARYLDAGGGGGYIAKYVSGSETSLTSDHGAGGGDFNETLFVSANGTTITATREGSGITGSPVTDSSITTGNYVGFEIYDGFVNPGEETYVDDFASTNGGGGGGSSVALTGSAANASAGNADPIVARDLAGRGAAASTGTGNLLNLADLQAHGDAASTGAANLALGADLQGSGSAASAGTGDLLLGADLQGHGDATTSGTGDVLLGAALTGHGDAASTAAGDALLSADLQAHGDAATAGVADAVLAAAIEGHGDAASGGTADLLTLGGVDLAGRGDASSAGTGDLTLVADLSGRGDACSAGSGTIDVGSANTVSLAGEGHATSSGVGTLQILADLAGSGGNATQGAAELLVALALAGTGTSSTAGLATLATVALVTNPIRVRVYGPQNRATAYGPDRVLAQHGPSRLKAWEQG